MTRSVLLRLRTHLEIFRANIKLSNLSGATVSAQERKKRAEKALEMGRDARKLARETAQEHLRVLPQDRGQWLSVNFETAAAMIVDEWEKLEQSLRMDTFYQPLSMDEQTAIVRAFNFSE